MATTLTCDTSVVIAGLSSWHTAHASARATLRRIDWLAAHVVAEAVSVLSRLPRGHAVSISDAIGLVRPLAEGRVRQLRADRYLVVLGTLGPAGLGGGAVYDAVIGATAREHDSVLVTLDARAQRVYAAVGTRIELLD